MKVFIYVGKNINESWERKTNEVLKMLYREPYITAYTKTQKLVWLDHVMRISKKMMSKLNLNRKPIRKRRPKKHPKIK